MRRHCRCRKCRKRKTLARAPATYLRPPKCECGGVLRLDKDADSRPWRRKPLCRCLGVPFTHRPQTHGYLTHKGGYVLAWCIHTTEAQAARFQQHEEHHDA